MLTATAKARTPTKAPQAAPTKFKLQSIIIKRVPFTKIKTASYNPRVDLKPGDPEYKKLLKSLIKSNYVDPMIWNRRTGNLVGGHQRLKILKQLGVTAAQVVVQDLSDQEEKALNIALNHNTGRSDSFKLGGLLSELDLAGVDLEPTGFTKKELAKLMNWEKTTFSPVSLDEQPKLDTRKKTKCPECGHEFYPS